MCRAKGRQTSLSPLFLLFLDHKFDHQPYLPEMKSGIKRKENDYDNYILNRPH